MIVRIASCTLSVAALLGVGVYLYSEQSHGDWCDSACVKTYGGISQVQQEISRAGYAATERHHGVAPGTLSR